jgi:hypothetical protein
MRGAVFNGERMQQTQDGRWRRKRKRNWLTDYDESIRRDAGSAEKTVPGARNERVLCEG